MERPDQFHLREHGSVGTYIDKKYKNRPRNFLVFKKKFTYCPRLEHIKAKNKVIDKGFYSKINDKKLEL